MKTVISQHRKDYLLDYQKRWMAKRRLEWIQSQGGQCVGCGSKERLEIDHKDPSTKEFPVSIIWSWSEERRFKELAKCQVLCEDCHKGKTTYEAISFPENSHGTVTGYETHGCRCDKCKLWKKIKNKKRYLK
jgi:5-methylcytosine-specific restriction endonuclease McrA